MPSNDNMTPFGAMLFEAFAPQPFRFSDFDRAVKEMSPEDIEALLASEKLEKNL